MPVGAPGMAVPEAARRRTLPAQLMPLKGEESARRGQKELDCYFRRACGSSLLLEIKACKDAQLKVR